MSAAEQHQHYEVLARKHRPQRFADLIGQEHVAQTLQRAISGNKLAHAFLFTGIRGVGKTTAARLLARALNCTKSTKSQEPTPEPCPDPRSADACDNCREIADSRSLDVAEIDGASNRGIDSIRELNENVRYQPAKGRYRVYIIDEAHMVTREGFNALLKTLEEPPRHVKFIFATTAVDKFPDTIVSRCQRYDFRRIPLELIQKHLREVATHEKVEIPDRALYTIAREAQGSMRDAESLLDRILAFSGATISESAAAEVMGVTERGTLFAVAEAILRGEAKRALELLDAVHASGGDLERFARDLLEHWRNLVVAALYDGGRGILRELPENELEELGRQLALRPLGELQRLFRIARQGVEELRYADLPRFVLEMSVVRMATLEPAVPVDEVLNRLESLSSGGAGGGGAPPAGGRPPTAGRAPVTRAPRADASAGAPVRPARAADTAKEAVEERTRSEETANPGREASPDARLADGGDGPVGARWDEFLGFVQERRLALYFSLSHARVVERTNGRMVLGAAGEKFRRALESPATMGEIETLAGEFFGSAYRVSIVPVDDEARRAVSPAPPPPTATLDDPAVKRAVKMLGGEVREVRNRRERKDR